jgi:CxxC motif-containing protein
VDFTSAYIGKSSKASPGREARRAKADVASMDKEWRKTPRQRSVDKDEINQTKRIVAPKIEIKRAE